MTVQTFKPGDFVWKKNGRYGGPGVITGGTQEDPQGYRLFNVAFAIAGGYGYFVHVFPATALEPLIAGHEGEAICRRIAAMALGVNGKGDNHGS